ncbi:YhgE/Pip domain-containing protein [Variovorax sp. PAMC 28711]|uniref:YhgE/Pip domain-containing protein n=1 Tax=Variovorax sp. PAMC 28711 TaxID=1795631 RepID=UPI00078E70C6|nr:YhgE/Pip domain-containing protein [Variovorax sp. PAMC 28711]AMM26509.1 hypothetical protein AX767_20725 [Variovorax sp. PAMC 28711]
MRYLSSLLLGILAIARAELTLVRRFPRILLAMAAIGAVPALYALIYLTSVWDPAGHTADLPVAIVNEDKGVTYFGRTVNVGVELNRTLLEKRAFGFRPMADAEAARAEVRRGTLAFALLIPADFSANAVPGTQRGAGQLVVYTSEGNNYTSAGFARRFAGELGHQVNEMLNEQRWGLVLNAAAGSQERLTQLKQGLLQLRDGSQMLASGSAQYSVAAREVGTGFKQVNGGIRTIDSKLPADADLRALKSGAQQVAAGQRELGSGLAQIDDGIGQLAGGAMQLGDGARRMQKESAGIPFVGDRLSTGASELAAGADKLRAGLGQAQAGTAQAIEGNQMLIAGASQVESGVGRLTDGMTALSAGVRTMAGKLPDDRKLDEFMQGGVQLAQGADRLLTGVRTIEAALPTSITRIEGSAQGLADSVEPKIEVVAPVANNGSAFVPNMVSVALWIGAVMAGFIFNMRIVLSDHHHYPRLSKTLGKMTMPAVVMLLQCALVLATLIGVLHVEAPRVVALGVTMVLASIVFLAVLTAMLHVFGDFGRILTVLLLTLQLSAGGGVLPVELSAGFFRTVHDWLPFSWVVQAFRAVMFGAFDNAWGTACGMVVLSGAVAVALMALFGKWKAVGMDDYKPTIDV